MSRLLLKSLVDQNRCLKENNETIYGNSSRDIFFNYPKWACYGDRAIDTDEEERKEGNEPF